MNVFPFQARQKELGDKLDLGSYLIKPVQRMGKYSLLLRVSSLWISLQLWSQYLINVRSVLEFQDLIKALDVGHPKIAELKVTAVWEILLHYFFQTSAVLFGRGGGGADIFTPGVRAHHLCGGARLSTEVLTPRDLCRSSRRAYVLCKLDRIWKEITALF